MQFKEDTSRRRYFVFAILLAGFIVWYIHHHLTRLIGQPSVVVVIDLLSFGWLFFSLSASHFHRDIIPSSHRKNRRSRQFLNGLRVSVVIPTFNEDPVALRACLDSLLIQTRLPQRIHLVDDGSEIDGIPNMSSKEVFREWAKTAPHNIELAYDYVSNRKKRHAQAVAFRDDTKADVWVTVDSDTVLDRKAIEEGVNGFADPRVKAVAGLLLGLNYNANFLTRLVELGFTMSFLNGRSSWSFLRSVVVSCGGLAFYDGEVVRKYLPHYLRQTVWGRRVASGDDRMMTCYALREGHTIIQERSVGYTLLPEKLGHLTRQRIRWWRSFFWGGGWLLQEFPLTKPAWWMVAWQFNSFIFYTFAIPYIFILHPIEAGTFAWGFLGVTAMLSYVRSVRYLIVKRPDQTYLSQLMTFACAPLTSLLNLYLCTCLQYPGLFTFLKTKWSTRQNVEVGITEAPLTRPTEIMTGSE